MMQVRPTGSSEWYNPSRDLLNSFHKFIKLALQRFERLPEAAEDIRQYTEAGIQTEQIKEALYVAETLRGLVNRSKEGALTEQELSLALKDLPSPVFDKISRLIVEAFFEKYRHWQSEIGREANDK